MCLSIIILSLFTINALIMDGVFIAKRLKKRKKTNSISVDLFKTTFKNNINEFSTKKLAIENQFNVKMTAIIKETSYLVIQDVILMYGQAIEDLSHDDIIYRQDILELYLYKHLGDVIFLKLRSLFIHNQSFIIEGTELNDVIENISREILDSVILGLSSSDLTFNGLDKVLENSYKGVIDRLRQAVKKFAEINRGREDSVKKLLFEQNKKIKALGLGD